MAPFLLHFSLNLTQTLSCFHDFHMKFLAILLYFCPSCLLQLTTVYLCYAYSSFGTLMGIESQGGKPGIRVASEALTQISSLHTVWIKIILINNNDKNENDLPLYPHTWLCCSQGLGDLAGCQAWASEVGEPSSGHWSTRDLPAHRNINQQQLSQRSPLHC